MTIVPLKYLETYCVASKFGLSLVGIKIVSVFLSLYSWVPRSYHLETSIRTSYHFIKIQNASIYRVSTCTIFYIHGLFGSFSNFLNLILFTLKNQHKQFLRTSNFGSKY